MKICELQRPFYQPTLVFEFPPDDCKSLDLILQRLPSFCLQELKVKRMDSFRLSIRSEPLRSAILLASSIKANGVGGATATLPGDLVISKNSRSHIETIIASEMIDVRWTELVSISGSAIAIDLFTDCWQEIVSPIIACPLIEALMATNRYLSV